MTSTGRRALRSALAVALLACTLPSQARADDAPACEKNVSFALTQATTDGCLNKTADNHWETSDAVKLNGIPIKPAPETKLVLDGPSDESQGGKISLTAEITVAGFTLKQQVITTNLPAGGNGEEQDFVTLEPAADQKLFGLTLNGKVSLRLGRTQDGAAYSNLVVIVALPDLLKRGPDDKSGGLTNTLALRIDDSGVKADAVKIEVENAYLGALELKNLCLSYTAAGSSTSACKPPDNSAAPAGCAEGNDESRWDGSAEMTLPTANRPKLGIFAGIRGGAFSYGGAQVSDLGTSVPLATGVFPDKFGLGLCVNPPPFRLKGTAGIKFGPKGSAYLDGSVEYTNSDPWVLEAKGSLSLNDQNVANGRLRYQSSGEIDFGFDANLNFGGGLFTVEGGVNGWYQPKNELYDVFGQAKVCAAKVVCTGGEVAVSNIGVAGCASLFSFPTVKLKWPPWKSRVDKVEVRAGGSYRWEDKKVETMGQSCGTGNFRVQKASTIAAAAHADKPLKIKLAKVVPAVVFRLTGRGAPPKVKIKGPDGTTVTADDDGEIKKGKYMFSQDDEANTTNVTIANPDVGEWTIRTLKGSAPLKAVAQAPVEPAAQADGEVTNEGEGDTHTLEYTFEDEPGQDIEFVEWGPESEQVIGRASDDGNCEREDDIPDDRLPGKPDISCGKLEFDPAPGPKGDRKILAVVMDGDMPVDRTTIAEYKAPKPDKLDAPQDVKIERNGVRASVFWMAVENADSYRVTVDLSDGEQMVYIVPAGEEHIDLPDAIPPGADMTVTVSALAEDETPGHVTEEKSEGQPGADEEPEPPSEDVG